MEIYTDTFSNRLLLAPKPVQEVIRYIHGLSKSYSECRRHEHENLQCCLGVEVESEIIRARMVSVNDSEQQRQSRDRPRRKRKDRCGGEGVNQGHSRISQH